MLGKKRNHSKSSINTLNNMIVPKLKKQIRNLIRQNISQRNRITNLLTANNSLKNSNYSLKNSNYSLKNSNYSLAIQLANANVKNKKQSKIIKNYKLAKKNSKIKNEMHETHEKILEQYEFEQIAKDQKNVSNAKKWKNLNKKKNKTIGEKILKILNNIDENKKKTENKKLNKKNFNFPFGTDIDDNTLSNFLRNIVKFINKNYPKKVKRALSGYFNNRKIANNIKLISDTNPIISTLKKDMIISLLLEENKSELTSLTAPILCNKLSEIPLIEIKVKENKKYTILNKTFLKQAVSTDIIGNIYEKVCQEYVADYDNNKHRVNIKQMLTKHIDKMNIYFGELPEDICGLTLYTGDVIINAKYLNLIYSGNTISDLSKNQAICSIFLTLLHEFSHILVRLVKAQLKNNAKSNQFEVSEDQNSPINEPNSGMKTYIIKEFPNIFAGKGNKIIDEFSELINDYRTNIGGKKNTSQNMKGGINESGEFFDYHLFGIKSYFDLTENESNYFLNLNNFKGSIDSYYKKLKMLYDQRKTITKSFPFKRKIPNLLTVAFKKCNLSHRSK